MIPDLTSWLLIHYGQEQMNPGLDRIRSAIKDLLPILNRKKIVIIAGTNGKGETTLRLSELLGMKKHVTWTSPHIQRITERFRSEKGEIDEDLLNSLVIECHEKVQKEDLKLSYYEFLFLVFCTWASRENPDYLLLEVGLGGRLDAVNILDADLVLLPSLSRDHQEILGERFDKILFEKLGTLRRKSTLIHFLDNQYLIERAQTFAEGVGAKVIPLKAFTNLPVYEFSLRNHVLAGAALCFLSEMPFVVNEWMTAGISLENRGEVIKDTNEWYLFGSHNVDGMRKLIQFLQRGTYNFSRPPFDAVIVAFSKRNSRDLRVMLRMLNKAGLGKVVVTIFDHPKAASVHSMEVLSREEGSEFAQNIETYVQGTNKNQRVLVTGSYYFLGHFKSIIRRR
jgi:dihydrofolate synthase / folylpolyglutamate synthase